MTKIQKVWLLVFLAMVVLPEILWSPIANIISEFLQNSNNVHPYRNNFLMNPDNITVLNLVLFLQSLGLILSIIILIKTKKDFLSWLFLILLIIIAIPVVYIFYLSMTLGRHGID
jgi:hypothetical protein